MTTPSELRMTTPRSTSSNIAPLKFVLKYLRLEDSISWGSTIWSKQVCSLNSWNHAGTAWQNLQFYQVTMKPSVSEIFSFDTKWPMLWLQREAQPEVCPELASLSLKKSPRQLYLYPPNQSSLPKPTGIFHNSIRHASHPHNLLSRRDKWDHE